MCLWNPCRPSGRPTQASRTLSVDRLLLAGALALLVPGFVNAQPTTTRVGDGPGGAQENRGGIRTEMAQTQQPLITESDWVSLRPQFGMRGLLGTSLGAFSDKVGLSGGLAAELTLGLGDWPIRIGGGWSVLWYTSDPRGDVTTGSGISTVYALLRARPEAGRVRPYVDGLVGLNHLFTETSTTKHGDFALSYGAGGGVMVELDRLPNGARFDLDVGARYVFGERAEYLVPGSLGVNRSRTDVLTIHAGLTFGF